MNNNDIKASIKVIVICIVLAVLSPYIFGVLGIVFKGILWLILGIIIVITLSVMYFKYKIKKESKDFYSFHEKEKPQGDNAKNVESDSDIDYSDSTIVDVEEYEEVDDEKQNNKDNEE